MAITIKSPLPGTFYHAASPEDPPFKKIGDSVAVGEPVGLVEVMKNFMEIKSTAAGVVTKILLDNGSAVSAGQDLIELEE